MNHTRHSPHTYTHIQAHTTTHAQCQVIQISFITFWAKKRTKTVAKSRLFGVLFMRLTAKINKTGSQKGMQRVSQKVTQKRKEAKVVEHEIEKKGCPMSKRKR